VAKKLLIVLVTICFAGCTTYELPSAGSDHPANPQARQGHASPESSILEIDRDRLPSKPPELRQEGMKHMNEDDGLQSHHEDLEDRKRELLDG